MFGSPPMILRLLFLLIFSGFLSFSSTGQEVFGYKKYTVEDGLPSSHVYKVIQDQKGFIWVATDGGVAKFDGYKFKKFTAKDGLPGDDVFDLAEDHEGKVWLSTFNEIGYIYQDKYYKIDPPKGVDVSGVVFHYIINYGDKSLHYVELQERKEFLRIESDSVSKFYPFLETSMEKYKKRGLRNIGFLGLGTDDIPYFSHFTYGRGLVLISKSIFPDNSEFYDQFLEMHAIGNIVKGNTRIHPLPQKREAIFDLRNRLFKYDMTESLIYEYRLNRSLKSQVDIQTYLLSETELLIRGEEDYLFNLLTEELTEITFLKNKVISAGVRDKDGSLWFSGGKGLLFIPEVVLKLEKPIDNLNGKSVTTAFRSEEFLWFGTEKQSLIKIDKNENIVDYPILIDKENSQKSVLGISSLKDKSLIVGGNFGLVNISKTEMEKEILNKKKRVSSIYDSLVVNDYVGVAHFTVKSMTGGNNGVYIGSSVGTNFYSRENPIAQVKDENGVTKREERVYAIAIDSLQRVFTGKKSGLYVSADKNIEVKELDYSISELEVDKDNILWIGTEGGGLFYRAKGQIYAVNETDGKTIKSIQFYKNQIWVIADSDLLKLEISKETKAYSLFFSDSADGLGVKSVNSFFIDGDYVYLFRDEQVNKMSVSSFNWDKKSRELFFTGIKINGEYREPESEYFLKASENILEINYVSIEYNRPRDVNYEYQMEGLDTVWRSSNSLKQEFWSLPPGDYTFSVRAGLNSQNISDTKSIHFHIATPWWQKPSFWIITGLGFMLTVIGIATYRSRLIIKREKEKARLEEQITEMRLQALQSQMNPHFIFNSLQAIQDYIFDKNEEQANLYLVKFSRLMRLILESSRKKTILLSEELRLIDLYVSLEQLRFSESFDYECKLSDNLNPEEEHIPSMLVQPFIENAVNHGIFRKEDGRGKVKLRIRKDGDTLIIEVEDNGIGIQAAMEYKKQSDKQEASRALEIVRERTSIYNKTAARDIDLRIENIEGETGSSIGTKVTLVVKLPTKSITYNLQSRR